MAVDTYGLAGGTCFCGFEVAFCDTAGFEANGVFVFFTRRQQHMLFRQTAKLYPPEVAGMGALRFTLKRLVTVNGPVYN